MKMLDELYELAEKEDIEVISCDLPKARCLAVMDGEGSCFIGMDPMYINSYGEEAELLAHELGHCLTGSFYNISSPYDLRQKHENRADFWMVSHLLPPDKLSRLLSEGIWEPWRIAEACGLSQELVEKALRIYQSKSML